MKNELTDEFYKAYRSKPLDSDSMVRDALVDHGFAHMICHIAGREDVINPLSNQGYEVLADGFGGYLESMMAYFSEKRPVLLQLYGCELSEEDQNAVRRAVRNHFLMKAVKSQNATKGNKLQIFWFALCLLGVCLMLLLTDDTSRNQVVLNLVFVLFYFFGDRLTGFVLLDRRSIREEKARYIQMASMKIIFTGTNSITSITDEQAEEYRKEVLANAGAEATIR